MIFVICKECHVILVCEFFFCDNLSGNIVVFLTQQPETKNSNKESRYNQNHASCGGNTGRVCRFRSDQPESDCKQGRR